MVPMDSLYKLAYGLSIGRSPDDVTWPDDVINAYEYHKHLFKMLLQMDSRSGSYDVTDDVITYNHCRNFGAKYLGNEAR